MKGWKQRIKRRRVEAGGKARNVWVEVDCDGEGGRSFEVKETKMKICRMKEKIKGD